MSTLIKAASLSPRQGAAFAFDDLGKRPKPETNHFEPAGPYAAAPATVEEVLDGQIGRQLGALAAAVDAIHLAKAQWIGQWERSAVGLATAIAARLLRREVERTPEVALVLVREALELAAGSTDVQLRMHPDDLAALGPQVEHLAGELGRLGETKIVADAGITRGGCRVETRFGTIDQQFEAQLARIERELT